MAGASSGSCMHFGNELQINDAGYLSRNSMNYAHWQVNRRFTELPAESRYASKDWRWRVSTDSQRSRRSCSTISSASAARAGCATAATSTGRSTSTAPASTTCSRAATARSSCRRTSTATSSTSGRAWAAGVTTSRWKRISGGLAGNDKIGYRVEVEPRYFISDALNVYVGLEAERTPDWLVWQQDTLFGSFDRHASELERRLQLDHDEPARAAPEAAGDRPGCGPAPGVSRRCGGQLDSDRRAGRAISASATSACRSATVTSSRRSHIYMWCTAAAASTRKRTGRRARTAWLPRQLQPARRRAAADQAQLPLRDVNPAAPAPVASPPLPKRRLRR